MSSLPAVNLHGLAATFRGLSKANAVLQAAEHGELFEGYRHSALDVFGVGLVRSFRGSATAAATARGAANG
jgi:hypothetical protein